MQTLVRIYCNIILTVVLSLFQCGCSLLFWTDWGNMEPRIERCSMSGDYRSTIVQIDEVPDGKWPNGLTLDYQLKRVYWVDAKLVPELET